MAKPLVSICISTYNRKERIRRMVKDILSIQDERFDLWIVDDNSPYDIREVLSDIQDERLTIVKNDANKGARGNWFKTLDSGDGEFTLQVLDRDIIETQYISSILDIIEKEQNCGFGYVGGYASDNQSEKGETYTVFPAGEDAEAELGCVLIHPTGYFVKRDRWKAIKDKERFFFTENYGIYPHAYISAELAKESSALAIKYDFARIVDESNRYNNASRFYNKSDRDFWWTDKSRENELLAGINYISDELDISAQIKEKCCLLRFSEAITAATIINRTHSRWIENCSHYNIEPRFLSESELLEINSRFREIMTEIVRQRDFFRDKEKTLGLVNQICEKNIAAIVDTPDRDELRIKSEKYFNKFERYYYLMDAWVKLYQANISVSSLLTKMDIRTIAIYGDGKSGKRLFDDLKNSDIQVKYFIDKNADKLIEAVPVVKPDEELLSVDAVVISLPDAYTAISSMLLEKCNYKMISIEDLIYSGFC